MVALLRLKAGNANLQLAPDLGGGIASLDLAGKPVLRPWSQKMEEGPFALACNVLVPFSNRISGGGFSFQGEWYEIAPNRDAEPFPIHGDGFQRPWMISSRTENSATLTLENGRIGPFEYRAEQIFSLSPDGLRVELNIINNGSQALPFGCGFHPWFPRDENTKLGFSANGFWLEDAPQIPTTRLPVDENPGWNFSDGKFLPDRGFDHGWEGWGGKAHLEQAGAYMSVDISASENLGCAIIYTQGKGGDFVCFEPVSHPVDAYNRSGMPGLKILDPGQSMSVWMRLQWDKDAR
jgi:aldose 1-epimerase